MWQPIETAPVGCTVLLFMKNKKVRIGGYDKPSMRGGGSLMWDAYWHHAGRKSNKMEIGLAEGLNATHWIPLPEPPGAYE